MLFKAAELEKLLIHSQNKNILNDLLSAIESDLVSDAGDEWRLSVLQKLRDADENKLFKRACMELEERFFNTSLLPQ
ncbi:MAG: hypothetical protein K0R55_235 [Sporomusa sp.]|jgi:hypothetical protein|nr:hypothetical protein [Sporomusa sp.]